jgi:hypothetical protein
VRNGAIEAGLIESAVPMTAPEDCVEHAKRTAFIAVHL